MLVALYPTVRLFLLETPTDNGTMVKNRPTLQRTSWAKVTTLTFWTCWASFSWRTQTALPSCEPCWSYCSSWTFLSSAT